MRIIFFGPAKSVASTEMEPMITEEQEYQEKLKSAKSWLDPYDNALLQSLFHNPEFSSMSKKRFFEAVSKKYPHISYGDVSEFLEDKMKYRYYLMNLKQHGKLTTRKPRSAKPENKKRQHKTAIRVLKPNHKWQMDLTNPPIGVDSGEYKFIFTIIDVFSKYAFGIPIRDKKGETIASYLDGIFTSILKKYFDGVVDSLALPKYLQSDNGKEFVNHHVAEILKKHNVIQLLNPAYEHLGVIERFNHTLKQMIAHASEIALTKTNFDVLVATCIDLYNNRIHSSHKYSPAEVHFSDDPAVRWNAHKIVSASYDKSNDEVVPHKVGAEVFVDIHNWPDLKPEIKKALHDEERTIGLAKILQRFKLPNAYEVYKIRSIYVVPKSKPPVYLYLLSSIPREPTEKIVHFDKFLLHQKINPIK